MGGVADSDRLAIGADDAGAEEVRWDPGERRDVVSDDSLVDRPVTLVGVDEQPADHLLLRQPSGRDVAVGRFIRICVHGGQSRSGASRPKRPVSGPRQASGAARQRAKVRGVTTVSTQAVEKRPTSSSLCVADQRLGGPLEPGGHGAHVVDGDGHRPSVSRRLAARDSRRCGLTSVLRYGAGRWPSRQPYATRCRPACTRRGGLLDPGAVLQLQRTAGNRAVGIEIGEVTVEPVCPSYERAERARAASPAGVLYADVSLAGGHGIDSAAGDSVVVADFPIGSADLRPSTVAQLRSSWIGILERQSTVKYEIVGYSDCAGEGGRNTTLRRARAQAVAALFPKTAARATGIRGEPVTEHAVDNSTPEHRALDRSVIIRLPPSTPPPPAPTTEPEQPHVVIPRREPPTKGCKRPWREMLSVAWPAAKIMVEKALEMAYTGKGSVNTYLLERYFGPDALTNIVPIRQGYQNILSKWFDWDPNFECHEQAEARCPNTNPHKVTLAYVTKKGGVAVHPDALWQRARLHRGLPQLHRQPPGAVLDRRARAQPPSRQHPRQRILRRPARVRPPTAKAIRNADSYAQYARTVFNLSI